jgi:ornithine lipid ester-linked acyl 2-hydroxylase
MSRLIKRIKNVMIDMFVQAEAKGHFRKLPAFERDLGEYPELAVLTQNYAVIRSECEALLTGGLKLPTMDELGDYTVGGIHQIAWKNFMFKSGDFIEHNCALAPQTANVLRTIPGLYTALFSVLEPHQYIKPHWGYWKGFVRCHLGVIIPDDNRENLCWLRINQQSQTWGGDLSVIAQGEKYYWKNGAAVLFDDTFLHDAANESDAVRVVLWLDIARKMPWMLSWMNRLLLWIGHRTPGIRQIRTNAKVRTTD